MRSRKRVARTRDDNGRDRRNKGTTTAWTRMRMTKGRPDAQDDQHLTPLLLAGWKAGSNGDRRRGDREDGDDNAAQHDGTACPHP
jgi:hypothetical protein